MFNNEIMIMEEQKQLTGNELVAIPMNVINKIIAYMQKRPYDEVFIMLDEIKTTSRLVTIAEPLPPVQEPEAPEESK